MPYYVCKGAKLKCSMGSDQSALEVVHLEKPVRICGQNMAGIMDHKPMMNIKPFGQCKSLANPVVASATAANYGRLQEMPCVPNTTSPWLNGKMNFLVKGQPALLDCSKCLCLWAGVIEITDAGQKLMSCGSGGPASQEAGASTAGADSVAAVPDGSGLASQGTGAGSARLLVREVIGEKEAAPGGKAQYWVVKYNKGESEVSQEEKNRIRWAVKVNGGIAELKGKNGNSIAIEIKNDWAGKEIAVMACVEGFNEKEWAGKTIAVMAYLKEPQKEASRETKVAKFPILIAQSKHKPGMDEKGIDVAEDMRYGDMTKDEILKMFTRGSLEGIYNYITFGNADTHFRGFEDMATSLFAQNHIKLQMSVFPEDLSEECYKSEEKLVYVNLEDNIKSMIRHFRNGGGKNYSDKRLTEATMCHKDTIRFFNDIRKNFAKQLADKKGNLILIEPKEYVNRPMYNTLADKFKGLTISLNDTWAYKVWITEYQLEKDRTYKGKMKIVIYDHFGLDSNDVKLTKPAHHLNGFYHWFALQRWEGFKEKYKPFITVIEKELTFKWKLPEQK